MKNKIYESLMNNKSQVGESPLYFLKCDESKDIVTGKSHHCFLFVLRGALRCLFSGFSCQSLNLKEGNMTIIDLSQLASCSCSDNTIIMIFEIPRQMSLLIQTVPISSEIIPMNEDLNIWCQNTLTFCLENISDKVDYSHFCRNLISILLNYPHGLLGMHYAPLYACSTRCRRGQEFCATK